MNILRQMFPIWLVFWGYDTVWLAHSPDLTRVIFVVGLSEGRGVWLSTPPGNLLDLKKAIHKEIQ